ncbi:MAG: dihydrolipoamide acetyltransferase family protein [Burkholderiaceae bacterium]
MQQTLTLPKLGLTMTEGIVSEWLKQPGDTFVAGDILYVVENDKVANEIAADAAGTLTEVLVQAGDTAAVGAVIAHWDDGLAEESGVSEQASPAGAASSAAPAGATAAPAPEKTSDAPTPSPSGPSASEGTHRKIATPYARRLAQSRGIALEDLDGSGPGGRIKAADVEAYQGRRAAAASGQGLPAGRAQGVASAPASAELMTGQTLSAPSTMQATIARRLTASKQQIPHFYLALDIDATRLVALRKEINRAQNEHRLTLNHFIVMAVARALGRMPEANRVWTDDGIVSFSRVDVGVAVNTAEGLLAPAVCDVGDVSLGTLAARLNGVIERARSGRMSHADLGSPAITVSNAGMHHVHFMGSIINPGQAMILGVGSVKGVFRPDSEGRPELRQEMGVVLSADHRIIDGVHGLKFLNIVRELLEQPVQLLVH